MDGILPLPLLLQGLDGPMQKEMIRTIFTQEGIYSDVELAEIVTVLPYPDEFWHILKNDLVSFMRFKDLWTDKESECLRNLRAILLLNLQKFKDVAYRFVRTVYPETRQIDDLTYENVFTILNRPLHETSAFISTIMPKTKGYIEMKKKEYIEIIENPTTRSEGLKLAENLIRRHYHSYVANYLWWPASKALMLALLQQPLELRERITGSNDRGWVPRDYIDLCRSPLMWETD
jgi:hypothetical protein